MICRRAKSFGGIFFKKLREPTGNMTVLCLSLMHLLAEDERLVYLPSTNATAHDTQCCLLIAGDYIFAKRSVLRNYVV